VLADDPQLTVRLPEPAIPAPLRVVLDTHLRTPSGCRVLDGSVPTLVVHGEGARTTDSRFDGVELARA
jgi:diaminohydroxyphosphoribosylaminopyrimidine deaminase/5-amino-6-(5-phosphoribosylamino)uracil reductase